MTEDLFSRAGDTEPDQPRSRGRKITIAVISGALVLLLGAAAAAAVYLNSLRGAYESSVNVIDQEDTFPEESDRPERPTREENGEEVEDEQLNILLIGSDSGGGSGAEEDVAWLPNASRADTIMWLHIPHERDSIQLMSIMRDTWVPIPGHEEAKINASLSLGEGSSVAVKTVEDLVGVPVDHVATVDMIGFQNLVAEMDGVTVDVPTSFTSRDGYEFAAGPQHMDSAMAMSFVRERKSFSDGDYTRVANQQAFVNGVLDEVLTASTLTNPARIHGMVSDLAPHMAVDSDLADAGYATDIAWSLRDVRGSDIDMFTLPNHGLGTVGSESVVVADFDAFAEAGEAMRAGEFREFAAEN
ncbi:LCP family protein [Nesterenkonia sphaerica]|uniref:LCP family protein n=1 Tax=Nesterenkonia sphaerica TaxID=1804988 RepID=UPI0014087163|nr:LCP family protein [Nesterenkonia sphaerica]